MRLGHLQAVCRAGDFEANLATVVRGLERAADERLDIVSFPESFLGGYWRSEERCRAHAWAIDGPEMRHLSELCRGFPSTFLVGFNERRGDLLYNTVAVIERGARLGHYSKAFPVLPYFTPGRETPVFQRDGVTFGVIICADGGYPEPARLLVMKGARILFAPHYNYIGQETLLDHYVHVRHDHVARAIENGVFFVRGNNVEEGTQASLERDGVGYGDSYILDPNGQIVAAAGLHAETLLWADIDLERRYYGRHNKAARSAAVFGAELAALAERGDQTR